ncbi:hypothetical protein K501DRAFT_151978, partial [Backusella circina FSU 941]
LEKRTTANTSSSFDITFQCYHVPNSTCEKAKRSFEKAAQIISSVVLFKEPVRVNATLMSFCQMGSECNKGMMTLGGSSPTRSIPLINTDGLSRLHPQALVKQFDLSDHPSYFPYDIISVFNADAPFWFEEDDVAIKSNQADFAFVILHEFMHGLGFFSGWNQYLSTGAITPDPSPFLANQFIMLVNPISNALHTNQFVESAMDRLIHILFYDENNDITETRSLSSITKQLNRIQANNVTELLESPDFYPALEMNTISTEAYSLGVILPSEENEVILLETGLKPFQPGSSISHVAYEEYTHKQDFLMRYMQDRGMTLDDAVKRGGGDGPIGPLLLRILEEIGYSTIKKPNNIPPLITNNAL